MSRPKKPHTPVSVRLDSSVYKALKKYSEDTRQTKTAIIEKAILLLISKYDKQKEALKTLNPNEWDEILY